jgi:hypothetical protein
LYTGRRGTQQSILTLLAAEPCTLRFRH